MECINCTKIIEKGTVWCSMDCKKEFLIKFYNKGYCERMFELKEQKK